MWHRIRQVVLTPWSARSATLFTIVAGVALLLILDRSERMRSAEWQVDEGQRIAESYFWRLVETGAFDDGDWFRVITDSSHPQMSKYFFGLALRVQGVEPPRDLALPRYYETGGLAATGWRPPPHLIAAYSPLLQPARRAALLCNVVSWMTVTWLLLRWCGFGAAVLAAAVFTRHYLSASLFFHARSDALQACAFTLTLLPLALIWRNARGRAAIASAVLIGVFAAISFQTRLNGLLALGGASVVLVALAIRKKDRRPLLLLTVATIVCAAVSVISNPYYWAEPAPVPGLASSYLVSEPLPLRVVTRFQTQMQDLRTLLHDHAYAALKSPPDRVRFVGAVLFSGTAGLLLLAGTVAAALFLLPRSTRAHVLLPALWSITTIGVFALWLPLSWEPYVTLIFPTAVLFMAIGWHALTVAVVDVAMRRRAASTTP